MYNAYAPARSSTPGDQRTGQTCITFTLLLSSLSSLVVAVVYRKRARLHAPNAVFLCVPVGRAACYRLARLPPTHKRNGIRRRPTMDYHPSGGRQWAAPPNDTTGACGVRARTRVPWDSRDMTAPLHHHHCSYGHNIRYISLLRAIIIVSWPIVIVIIFICGIVSLWRSKLRNQCLRCARHNFYASSHV